MLYDSQSATIAHGTCRGRAAGRTEPPDARTPPWAIRRHQRCWRRRRALPATGARRTVPLSPAQQQEFLTRALEEGVFACRLLLRAQQELQTWPGTRLEPRLAHLRALAEAL